MIASFVLAAWALLSVVGNEQSRRIGEIESKIKQAEAGTEATKPAAISTTDHTAQADLPH